MILSRRAKRWERIKRDSRRLTSASLLSGVREPAGIVADHLERYFGEASSARISAESNI